MKGLTGLILKPYVMISPLSREECIQRMQEKFPTPIEFYTGTKSPSKSMQGYIDECGLRLFGRGNFYAKSGSRPFNVKFVSVGDHTQLICTSVFSVPQLIPAVMIIAFCGYLGIYGRLSLSLNSEAALLLIMGMVVIMSYVGTLGKFSADRRFIRFLETALQAAQMNGGRTEAQKQPKQKEIRPLHTVGARDLYKNRMGKLPIISYVLAVMGSMIAGWWIAGNWFS